MKVFCNQQELSLLTIPLEKGEKNVQRSWARLASQREAENEDADEMPRGVLLSCLACSDGFLVSAVLQTIIQTHCPIGHSSYTVVAMDTFQSIAFQILCQLLVQQHRADAICQCFGVSRLKQDTSRGVPLDFRESATSWLNYRNATRHGFQNR